MVIETRGYGGDITLNTNGCQISLMFIGRIRQQSYRRNLPTNDTLLALKAYKRRQLLFHYAFDIFISTFTQTM